MSARGSRAGGHVARDAAWLRPAAWLLAMLLLGGGTVTPAGAAEAGAIALPAPQREGGLSVAQALSRRRSVREFAKGPLSLGAVSQVLWAAQGITGDGNLRTAPSAGALYPLEIFLVAGAVSGLESAVYHYEPRGHRLWRIAVGDRRTALAGAALHQDWLATAPAVLVLGAVPKRTARKYGSRAERYVDLEAGHAAENAALQAVALGLGTCDVGAFRDGRVKEVLELPDEVEPLLLIPMGQPR